MESLIRRYRVSRLPHYASIFERTVPDPEEPDGMPCDDLDPFRPLDSTGVAVVLDEGEYFCLLFDNSSDRPAGAETE